jgi:hypothetical protein
MPRRWSRQRRHPVVSRMSESDDDDGDYRNGRGKSIARVRAPAAVVVSPPPPRPPPPRAALLPALAAALFVLAAAAASAPAAFAHPLPPPPAPRSLPPLPSPLPPPLNACPVVVRAAPGNWAADGTEPAAAAQAAAADQAAAAVEAATARVSDLLEGGGLGRPTAASVLAYVRTRATEPRPATSGALLAAAALSLLLLFFWRLVSRLQALFRACSSSRPFPAGRTAPTFPDTLAARAVAARQRATSSPGAVTARLAISAAAAAALSFGVLGAARARGALAPRLLERADAAGALLADLAARAEGARMALAGASLAAEALSSAVGPAVAAIGRAAADVALAEAAAVAEAAGLPPPSPPAPLALPPPPAFDVAAATEPLLQVRDSLGAAAASLDPILNSVRATLLPLLVEPPPPPPEDGDNDGGAPSPPRSRWWRMPEISPRNWRPVASDLDGWRFRAEVGLFSALAAAPCVLALCAWAGWRPGVATFVGSSLTFSTLAAAVALALALVAVVLRDGCPAAESIAMRFAPQRLRPVLGYYFGLGTGLLPPPPVGFLPLPSDPTGAGLAAALDESGVLGAEAGALLRQVLAAAQLDGGVGEGGGDGGNSSNNSTSSSFSSAATALDAPLAAALAAVPLRDADPACTTLAATGACDDESAELIIGTAQVPGRCMHACGRCNATELVSAGGGLVVDKKQALFFCQNGTALANATFELLDARDHMLVAADAATAQVVALMAALSRDRVLGPAYALPKALLCCAVPAAVLSAWLALTGAGAACLGAALAAVALLRRMDLAAAAAAAAGWRTGCCGCGGGGADGAAAGNNNVIIARAVPCSGGGGGGCSPSKARELLQLGEIQEARLERLRALDDAAEAAAAARRAAYAGAPRM